MSEIDELGVDAASSVLRLTLKRPHRAGAMTPEIVRAMLAALDGAAADDAMRVVVIASEGSNFCSGFDFGRMGGENGDAPPRRTSLHRRIDDGAHRLIERLTTIELPVVGSIRGHASAFGLGLALACDFPIASTTARFTAPFVRRGFTPDSGTSFFLPRLIGLARAKEMLMLGRTLSAEEAKAVGLVTRVVEDESLEAETEVLVEQLAHAATTSIGLTKWLLTANVTSDLPTALRNESLVEDISTSTKDGREGVKAFIEKRAPSFGGR